MIPPPSCPCGGLTGGVFPDPPAAGAPVAEGVPAPAPPPDPPLAPALKFVAAKAPPPPPAAVIVEKTELQPVRGFSYQRV